MSKYDKVRINHPITLDKDIEEDLQTLEDWLYRKKSMYTPDGITIVNTIKHHIQAQASEIAYFKNIALNKVDMTIELVDGKIIEHPTYKELQSKLNAIEEVVENTKNSDFNACHEILRYIVLKIKEILGDKQ